MLTGCRGGDEWKLLEGRLLLNCCESSSFCTKEKMLWRQQTLSRLIIASRGTYKLQVNVPCISSFPLFTFFDFAVTSGHIVTAPHQIRPNAWHSMKKLGVNAPNYHSRKTQPKPVWVLILRASLSSCKYFHKLVSRCEHWTPRDIYIRASHAS